MQASPPGRVAIVGLGPSARTYVDLCRGLGGRKRLADETWVINAWGGVLEHDRVFHMDDVRIQEIRAAAQPAGNVAGMLEWLRTHPGPVYTSRPHEAYPGLVAFPLEEVINDLGGMAYFNSTVAYAVAYAIWIGVKSLHLYGVDYTYPNGHHAERGRACVEYWLGVAVERGMEVAVAETSSLFDSCEGRPLYGYGAMGTLDYAFAEDDGGRLRVAFTERPSLPTAAEIEAAYDHSKHPSPLVRETSP